MIIENVSDKNPVKIDIADVQLEIDFWSSAAYCYIIGANPPPHVMEGFVKCV